MKILIVFLLISQSVAQYQNQYQSLFKYENPNKNERKNCSALKSVSPEKLLELGQKLPVRKADDDFKFPCWFDPSLARIGQKFARRNFGSIFMSHAFSLIPLLSDKQNQRVLFLTGRSTNPEKAYKRYVATAQQIHLWYNQDVLSPNWRQSVYNVRKIHEASSNYLEKLNQTMLKNYKATSYNNPTGFSPHAKMWRAFKLDLANSLRGMENRFRLQNYDSPDFLFNQYTMGMALWGFMAMPVMIPYRYGIVRFTELDLKGFVHLWTILAYMLGMQEEFIFCKDVVGAWDECKDYMSAIFQVHLVPQMLQLDFEGQLMVEALLEAIHKLVPPFPVDAMLINFLEATVGTVELRASNLRRQRKLLDFFFGTGANLFNYGPLKMFRFAQFMMNSMVWGEIQVGSKKTFGNPGRNSSVVALTHFYT